MHGTTEPISKQSPLVRKPFLDRMAERRGKAFRADVERLKSDPFFTLEQAARKWSITRERIRQIMVKAYGSGWIKDKRTRRHEITQEIGCRRDPRQKFYMAKNFDSCVGNAIKHEYEFVQECRKRGLAVSCPKDVHCDIVVNGYLIDVKSPRAECLHPKGTTPKYHCYISEAEFEVVDFVAFWHEAEKSWFIFPIKEVPNSGAVFMNVHKSDYRNARNCFWEYKDAWDLLTPPGGPHDDDM